MRRLWARDPRLFSDDPEVKAAVSGRLGWVGLASKASGEAEALAQAAAAAKDAGVADVLLLGMGGSSLAPMVISQVIGHAPGSPALHVLDTTSPWATVRLQERLVPRSTLVLVASKSGTTIEPASLYLIFRAWFDERLHEEAGGRFIAITDPGSPLETLATEQGFAAVFRAPSDVGGRYSALTPFGMVPSALSGIDLAPLLASASAMEAACSPDASDNPAADLAAFLADSHADGRDKLTLIASDGLAPFGLWIEQLVAESTGKTGTGVLPVLMRAPGDHAALGEDRAVVVMRTRDDDALAALPGQLPAGTPCREIVLDDAHDIGGEFVRWELATALLGHLLGVNPFDEPNVAEAKSATADILGGAGAPSHQLHVGDTWITTDLPTKPASEIGGLPAALEALLEGAGPGAYLAVLAYLPEDSELVAPLREALESVSHARRLACCLQIGPRYLHSTGQYHKGGPPTGRFLIVTARDAVGPTVPGRPYTLAELHRAQAEGDYVTLSAHHLPVVRVDLAEPAHGPVRMIAETLRGLA